ncbi:MAG: shikimate kinase [Alphaproteobacteria bacterium]|nr:shikimate kinase [Alphaproteobacteria bacterium]
MIIIITGLMGAGKSSSGKALSKLLGYGFIDLDKQIETSAGISIAEIFKRCGEPYFRNLESKILKETLANTQENSVLALGGGTFTTAENIRLCLQGGIVVWLNTDLDVIESRLKKSNLKKRPLLQEANVREILEKLLAKRKFSYANAHIEVNLTKDYPASYMAKYILSEINDYKLGKLHD